MSVRDQLEAVLRKHGICHDCCSPGKELVPDLLACVPQPSREELEKILNEEGITAPFRSQCVEKIMAWASGQTTRRWCEHIRKDTLEQEIFVLTMGQDLKQRICLVDDTWTVCPLCAQPRPTP